MTKRGRQRQRGRMRAMLRRLGHERHTTICGAFHNMEIIPGYFGGSVMGFDGDYHASNRLGWPRVSTLVLIHNPDATLRDRVFGRVDNIVHSGDIVNVDYKTIEERILNHSGLTTLSTAFDKSLHRTMIGASSDDATSTALEHDEHD